MWLKRRRQTHFVECCDESSVAVEGSHHQGVVLLVYIEHCLHVRFRVLQNKRDQWRISRISNKVGDKQSGSVVYKSLVSRMCSLSWRDISASWNSRQVRDVNSGVVWTLIMCVQTGSVHWWLGHRRKKPLHYKHWYQRTRKEGISVPVCNYFVQVIAINFHNSFLKFNWIENNLIWIK